ncbi:ROK family transcriptional regulator [Salsipaludibacter albus]|uniref:ROK family transcriptional regulator n=1 Tax=Salsipaludibacter albus TaxID=2849650 RepID=UPI001EE41736|nr:ROK family transcriptional regulator [Salsipaludibacter albus]MBY5163867.1 ROK family transcriptional regulator [Salsipaludibacter albus]
MADNSGADSPGEVLALIRDGRARTRSELARLTGMSRSTVSQRIEALLAGDYVYEAGEAPSSGGRPPQTLAFNRDAGVVLVADLGATHSRLAVADLSGDILAEHTGDIAIAEGPEKVIAWTMDGFARLLAEVDRRADEVRGIGMGLPGPVEYSAGRAVNPPIMPGWDGVEVPRLVQETYPVPVLVDNDVNIMALGEYWIRWRDRVDDMLFVKIGTGIGSGIVANGGIYRGQHGAAGDMGHIQVASAADVLCRCGNRGCLEAVAGGAALARQLTEAGTPSEDSRDVARRAMAGDGTANRLVRAAGRQIGEVLAGAVNLLNPGAIVLGGDIALAANQLVAGVRERIYERSTVLATHDLRIERTELGDRAGVVGAAVMIIESILLPSAVDEAITTHVRA